MKLALAGGLVATASVLCPLGCKYRRHAVHRPWPALPEFDAARVQARLVMPCAAQSHESCLQRPIVSVTQGVAVHPASIATLLATVIDGVRHPRFDGNGLPSDVELQSRQRHNPGIFAG